MHDDSNLKGAEAASIDLVLEQLGMVRPRIPARPPTLPHGPAYSCLPSCRPHPPPSCS